MIGRCYEQVFWFGGGSCESRYQQVPSKGVIIVIVANHPETTMKLRLKKGFVDIFSQPRELILYYTPLRALRYLHHDAEREGYTAILIKRFIIILARR